MNRNYYLRVQGGGQNGIKDGNDGPTGGRSWCASFVRFVTTGAGAAAVDISIYTILVRFCGIHALVANLVSRPLGGTFSFAVNKLWTFRSRTGGRWPGQFARYWILFGGAYALSEGLLALYLSVLSLHPLLAKPAAEATVGVFTFLAMRHWVFRRRGPPAP